MLRPSLLGRSRLRALAVAAVLATSGAALLVLPPPARADANDEARFYFERGNEILQNAMRARGSRRRTLLREAVAQYLEAIARVRSKNALYNLGLCYQELGEIEEAWSYFHEYRGMDAVTADERADADRRLETLRERVALVEVISEPAGAEVRVDRQDLAARGRTPLVFPVEPGEHRVLVSLAGHSPGEQRVSVERGRQQSISLRLAPLMVRVSLDSVPSGATATLDGQPIGRTPLRGRMAVGSHRLVLEHGGQRLERTLEVGPDGGSFTERFRAGPGDVVGDDGQRGTLAVRVNVGDAEIVVDGAVAGRGQVTLRLLPGPHEVEVRAARWATYSGRVVITTGAERTLQVQLRLADQTSTRFGLLPELTLSAAGVSLATAVVLSVWATARNDELDQLQQQYEASPSDQTARSARDVADDIRSRNLVADIFWGTTLVLGATSILLFVLDDDDPATSSSARFAATPIPGGGLGALRLTLDPPDRPTRQRRLARAGGWR